MNDWGPGTDLGGTTEADWRLAIAQIPSEARQRSLVGVLHEVDELLKPGSEHPLPAHAFDQPDTPWPERDPTLPSVDSRLGLIGGIVTVILLLLWRWSPFATSQRAASPTSRGGERIKKKEDKKDA